MFNLSYLKFCNFSKEKLTKASKDSAHFSAADYTVFIAVKSAENNYLVVKFVFYAFTR
jgi:hypothetical protein